MDELNLAIEGIKNKIKKLALRNNRLVEKIAELEQHTEYLKEQLETEIAKNKNLDDESTNLQIAHALERTNPKMAKQKINEILREIDKCYALLNR